MTRRPIYEINQIVITKTDSVRGSGKEGYDISLTYSTDKMLVDILNRARTEQKPDARLLVPEIKKVMGNARDGKEVEFGSDGDDLLEAFTAVLYQLGSSTDKVLKMVDRDGK